MTGNARNRALNIVFRADGGIRLGSGHVMRCLTLANELRRRGASIRFVSREQPGDLIGRIEDEGYRVERLRSAGLPGSGSRADPQGAGSNVSDDASATLAALGTGRIDWLIVDHYALDEQWERAVRPAVGRLLVIDDLADRAHECDVFLDQNWYGKQAPERHAGRVPERCVSLLGPRFALLQPEYAQVRGILPPRDGSVHRVLVFFGGSDSTDETGKALAALAAPGFAHLAVDVVLGANHPDRSRILELVRSRPATNLYENLPTLAGLMARADIALGAGGSTSWERLCLGLCSLVTTVAPNQVAITEAMAAAGLVYWIGHSTETTVDAYRRALQQATGKGLIESEPLVDGLGAKRVAETMMPTGSGALRLRQAREQDAILFFDWRNDPTTRAMSFAQEQISWPAHLAWFRRRLTDASARLYVAEADGLPVGQLRLDFETDHATLSYSIDRLVRGRGWGAWIVAAALERASQAQAIEVRAEVKAENEASRRVFARLGWVETRSADGRIVFRSPPRRSRSAAAARGKRSALH